MKIALILGIFSMILPVASHAQGVAETEPQKIYIQPSQLGFTGGEIFANVQGEWIPLAAIYSEASGLLAAIKKDPYHSRWTCECKYNNNGWDETCQRPLPNGKTCGKPRPW